MTRLSILRQKLNLTQEELSEKSGVSVRTIQRIEAGTKPKGFTLKALADALGVNTTELFEIDLADTSVEGKWLKIINLSALPFILFPPLNIVAPLLIMTLKKQSSFLTRRIVSIQILWTLGSILLLVLIMILNDWFGIKSRYTLLLPLIWVLLNVTIILMNAAEIEKSKTLRITPNFSLL
jgi:transcriptional regulator with XRE-family HTH domain